VTTASVSLATARPLAAALVLVLVETVVVAVLVPVLVLAEVVVLVRRRQCPSLTQLLSTRPSTTRMVQARLRRWLA
jgi:hypothetical protein